MHKRVCDLCEISPVELLFGSHDDEVEFLRYKILPHGISLFLEMTSAAGGDMVLVPQLGISTVLCNGCLSQFFKNRELILAKLSQKPRLVKEAIDNLGRVIAENESRLGEKREELKSLQNQIFYLEEDIKSRINYLARQKEQKLRLSNG